MVATQTTSRPAATLATPHLPGRMASVGRLAFGVMFTGGAAIHVAIVVTGTETYRQFADTAFIPFVKQAWLSVFMPPGGVVWAAAGRLRAGRGPAHLGRGTQDRPRLLAALAFHLGLMLFGWGFGSGASRCSLCWSACCATISATP